MRRSLVAAVAVAAILLAPAAASAATTKHHKLHHVAWHHPVHGAYGMYGARGIQSPSFGWADDPNVNTIDQNAGTLPDGISVNGQ